jgi:hypothetical protein
MASEEGDIIVKVGEIVKRDIYLYTEEEVKSRKKENWSENLGFLDWENANKKCKEVEGRRLPSVRELQQAYNAEVLELLEKYWSDEKVEAEDGYYVMNPIRGEIEAYRPIAKMDVRCRL